MDRGVAGGETGERENGKMYAKGEEGCAALQGVFWLVGVASRGPSCKRAAARD